MLQWLIFKPSKLGSLHDWKGKLGNLLVVFDSYCSGTKIYTAPSNGSVTVFRGLITKSRVHCTILHPSIPELLNFGAAAPDSGSAGILYLTLEHLMKMSS